MSVPVRYTAAVEFAVAEGGLNNTLQQEEQYHIQQHLQYEEQQSQQSYYHKQELCRKNCNLEEELVRRQAIQQQLLMQQRSSISSSLVPANTHLVPNITQTAIQSNSLYHKFQNMSSSEILSDSNEESHVNNATIMNIAEPGIEIVETADMSCIGNYKNSNGLESKWMGISDEGRYSMPGAAGLEYQKYELEKQGSPTENDVQIVDPLLMDIENKNKSVSFDAGFEAMTSDDLYNTLKEYDALQEKYHTILRLPKESKREVTAGGRDGSAYVLRCLKMWYELPSDVLFASMSLVDRFLDRMAVKPKHMACMSVASFHLAIKQLNLKPIPAEDLVTISQCGCTSGDLERMAGVIENKLGVQMDQVPITSVSYVRIYFALFRLLAKEIGGDFFEFYKQMIKLEELENRLEVLLCDVKTTVITPSTLALVLICLHLDFHIKESYTRGSPELKHVFEYILFLQQFMNIPDRVFTFGFSIVSGILSHYNGQNKQPYKQRLVWKLSSRTLRVLRPINRFSSDLPTIEEGRSNVVDESSRTRTESISSEEEEDWPTSPIIPIFEMCEERLA